MFDCRNYSSSADEFGQDTGMGNSHYGRFFNTQSCYLPDILVEKYKKEGKYK